MAATAHNGKRQTHNLSAAANWANDDPFCNLIHGSFNWSRVDGGTVDVSQINEYGFPKSTTGTGLFVLNYAVNSAVSGRSNRWIAKTDAPCTLSVNRLATLISGSFSGASPRAVFAFAETAGVFSDFQLTISNLNTEPSYIVVCHEDDEPRCDDFIAWLAGDNSKDPASVFRVEYLAKCALMGRIRFLNKRNENGANRYKHADEKSVRHFSFNSTVFRPSVFAGTATNTGQYFNVTLPGATLTDGQRLQFIAPITITQRTDMGINLNGTGNLPLLHQAYVDWNTAEVPPGSPLETTIINQLPQAGDIVDAWYCAAKNGWITRGHPSAKYNSGSNTGWPIELCMILCHAVGANPWFNVPYQMASDPTSEGVIGLATEIKAYRDAHAIDWMTVTIEITPNEGSWNWLFSSPHFAKAMEPDQNYMEFLSRCASRNAQAVHTIFGGFDKLEIYLGVQTEGTQSVFTPLVESARYISEMGGDTSHALKNWVTGFCGASYLTPLQVNTQWHTDLETEFTASSDPVRKNEILDEFVSDCDYSQKRTRFTAWGVWRDANMPGKNYVLYEHGLQGFTDATTTANKEFALEARNAPKLVKLLLLHWKDFKQSGGSPEGIATFDFSGSEWGQFSHLYDTPRETWNAIQAYEDGLEYYDGVCVDVSTTLVPFYGQSLALGSTPTELADLVSVDAAKAITGVAWDGTKLNVTASNDFADGQDVFIKDVGGTTQINNRSFTVSDRTAGGFSLKDHDGAYVAGASYGAYTAGGTVARCKTSSIHRMFNGGVRAHYDDPTLQSGNVNMFVKSKTQLAGLTMLRERVSKFETTCGETFAYGMGLNMRSPALFFSAARGAYQANQLAYDSLEGIIHFSNLYAMLKEGYEQVLAIGRVPKLGPIVFKQGEADGQLAVDAATWKANVEHVRQQIEDLGPGAFHGMPAPVFIMDQMSMFLSGKTYGQLAAAVMDLHRTNSKVFCAGPTYWCNHRATGDTHFTQAQYRSYGEHLGRVAQSIIDYGTWEPCAISSAVRAGNIIDVEINVPEGALVIDTTMVAAATNLGFTYTGAGITDVTITNDGSASGSATVQITLDAALPGNLGYAYDNGSSGWSGPVNGNRGNLRDSSPLTSTLDGQALRNWLCNDLLEVL